MSLAGLYYVTLEYATSHIGDGWLLQFRGTSWLSRLIQYGTGGVHSHSAMAARNNGTVDVLELREFIGGRRLPLEYHARHYPRAIDVFAPSSRFADLWRPQRAVEVMRNLTTRPYGYLGVGRLALCRVPLLWRLWPLELTDDPQSSAPFCSHAVASACRLGGGVDPVPRKPDYLVTPNDLTWSLFWEYRFSLESLPADAQTTISPDTLDP